MLELNNVHVAYGAVKALKGISLRIDAGEVVALLGANGAGKTTTLRAVSRTVSLAAGTISYADGDMAGVPSHDVVKAGIAHCPEGRRIFPDMTVLENLDLGAYSLNRDGGLQEQLDKVFGYFPVLAERRTQKGGTLSGGEQQMLAVGRALMSRSRLLMLDEPSLGLAPLIVETIFEIIRQINRNENVTIFLVEQNANEALLHADRAYILETGTIQMSGPARDLLNNDRVKAAYLGG